MLQLANMPTDPPPPSFQTSWPASEPDSTLTAMDVADQPLEGSATDGAASAQNTNGANNNNRVAVA